MSETFMGYAVFFDGKPFPSSGSTVTRDKNYLKACALLKLNKIRKYDLAVRHKYATGIDALWRAEKRLTLRRVYAK